MKQNSKFQSGTSLVEFIVSMSIFTTVLISATGAYFLYSTGSRKSFASQNVIDEGRYLLDTMSKEMRTGKNFSIDSSNIINFTDAESHNIKYDLSNDKIGKNINLEKNSDDSLKFIPITSNQINVDKLNFNITGNLVGDNLQPKITIAVKLSNKNDLGKKELDSSIYLQTTVSQRQTD